MRTKITVGNSTYVVIEKAGHFRAHLNHYCGWDSVWAYTEEDLTRRIRQIKSGGQ